MNFREAYERVTAIALKRGESFSLEVEAWHHKPYLQGETPATSIEFKIYSCNAGCFYRGPTLEQVVDAYENGLDLGEATATPEALEAVGSP